MDRVTPTAMVGKKPLVSKDGYILDGHHRWCKSFLNDETIGIIRVVMNIRPLLDLTKQYPKVQYSDINHFNHPIAA
jgi:hypothetical protein